MEEEEEEEKNVKMKSCRTRSTLYLLYNIEFKLRNLTLYPVEKKFY